MKYILILFFVTLSSVSQEIKLKKEQVLVDGNAWLKYKGCGFFSADCSLKLLSNNEEIIFIEIIKIPGAEPITQSNKDGNLTYFEIKFLGVNKTIELLDTYKNIIEIIYNSKCVNEDGSFNEDKLKRLVEKYGTKFSDRLDRNTNNNTTIIIKEEPRRSGVNINIGR